jgi:hypothetical protein
MDIFDGWYWLQGFTLAFIGQKDFEMTRWEIGLMQ